MTQSGTSPKIKNLSDETEPLLGRVACPFCEEGVNVDADDVYREVASWVHGPKQDGATMREPTGRYAHARCIELLKAGQSPDNEVLF